MAVHVNTVVATLLCSAISAAEVGTLIKVCNKVNALARFVFRIELFFYFFFEGKNGWKSQTLGVSWGWNFFLSLLFFCFVCVITSNRIDSEHLRELS